MDGLTVVSLLAPPTRPAHRAIVALLAEHAGIAARLVEGPDWQAQLHMLDTGVAQAAFICGLPYTRRSAALEPLAAPVQAGERYGGQPIYFSDLLVRAESPFASLADLRGARWASNEPGSLSGHVIMLAHLAAIGARQGFFGSARETGSHLASLAALLAGEADVAAIDSTVLDLATRDDPGPLERLRVVATLGPNPAPPFVVARSVPAVLRERLRATLTTLHTHGAGRAALELAGIARMAPTHDSDYNPIRILAASAQGVTLT